MPQEQATMTLPIDLVKPAIEAQVRASIIQALGQSDALIAKVVDQIMNARVDARGEPERYGNGTPWFTWAVNDVIKKAVQAAIVEHLGNKAEVIKAAVEAEMSKSKSPLVRSLVAAMAEGMAGVLKNSYRINVSFDKEG